MKFNNISQLISATALGLFLLPISAQAAVILQPSSSTASTTVNGSYASSYTHDQSGLSGSYTSGVGNFETTMTTLTHTKALESAKGWASTARPTLSTTPSASDAYIIFNMGSVVSVSRIGIWMFLAGNSTGGNADTDGTNEFEVFSSSDGTDTTSSLTSLGVFNLPVNNPETGFIFDITDATSQYFLVNVRTRYDNAANRDFATFGEVAFEAVPEPSVALLGFVGLIMLFRRRR